MSKGLKILYMTAAAVLLVGLGFMIAAFAITRGNFMRLRKPVNFEQKNYTVPAAGIVSILIDDENNAILLEPSNDDMIHITYYENEIMQYTITTSQAGNLEMRFVSKPVMYSIFDFNFKRSSAPTPVTIAVPADFSGRIDLYTQNSRIEAHGMRNLSQAEFKSSNGRIELKEIQATGRISVSTSNGAISITDVKADSIAANTSNGRVNVSDLDAASSIKLSTSNGSISGTIKGDIKEFDITSSTTNGKNNLPSELKLGDKQLDVHTSNGSIDIGFTENS
jgi:DUF4097 and DUF4098 domain-containing protein YvlB